MRVNYAHAYLMNDLRIGDIMQISPQKRSANLSINAALLAQAKDLEVNLSATFEAALGQEVKRLRGAKWLEENAEAIQAYNARVQTEGLALAEFRRF